MYGRLIASLRPVTITRRETSSYVSADHGYDDDDHELYDLSTDMRFHLVSPVHRDMKILLCC